MSWHVDRETGERVSLEWTEEMLAEQAEYLRPCLHESKELRRKTIANGSFQIVHQCLSCGEKVGNPVPTKAVAGPVPSFDEETLEIARHLHTSGLEDLIQKFIKQQRESADDWWSKYSAYLATDEWKARRAFVMKRAGRICEGCLSRPATQVHHLTYKHVGHEFMFELVAVCDLCHDRLHQDLGTGEGE